MNADLHSHTLASDGSLSPLALMQLARERGVDTLAITDHDTVAGCIEALDVVPAGLQLIAGIEFSTSWAGRGIHILGLNVDTTCPVLLGAVERQQDARDQRAKRIGHRLTQLGIEDPYPAVKLKAGVAAIGRPHFAAHLVEAGVVRDVATAFRKHLGPGKRGDVRCDWGELSEVIRWIRAAGGIAVLAHPSKYRMTMTKLRLLLDDFVAAGGRGIEVVCGQQHSNTTQRLARVAQDYELLASIGSDFHHPTAGWSLPGSCGTLPADLRPVWDAW